MKNHINLLSLAALLLLFSCNKDEPQPAVSGSISGTVSVYDPSTPLVKTPLENIKLWLVDYDYPFDTVTYVGNEAAIIDSAFTDAEGTYSFTNIPFGNYAVTPVPDTANYRFEATDPELPLSLTEANPDKQVSFSAPWPGGENEGFSCYVTLLNSDSSDAIYYRRANQQFAFFIPVMVWDRNSSFAIWPNPYFGTSNMQLELDPSILNHDYGYTLLFGTITNNFLYNFYNSADELIESYWITQDLGNTPAQSWWTIDMYAHTITIDSIR